MEPPAVVPPPFVAGPLRLHPFRGLRLVASRISDPASARAFARPYRDVAKRLDEWEQRGLLIRDQMRALYLHEYAGSGMVVRGLVGALEVSRRAVRGSDRAVLPHEGIYPAQADDLADRMGQMAINPTPILLVQRAPEPLRELLADARAEEPDHAFRDRSGQRHRLWTIADGDRLARIAALLAPTNALIADGHHRYGAYLRLQQRSPGTPADRGLAMIVDHDDTPLFLGAIHRVLAGTSPADLAAASRSVGLRVTTASREDAVAALSPSSLVVTDGADWLVVDINVADDEAVVEILHDRIVPMLGHGPTRISYHHAVADALVQAQPGHGTAVLVPAATLDQVHRIALDGRLLPQKATSFQPKPPFGVLLRALRDE